MENIQTSLKCNAEIFKIITHKIVLNTRGYVTKMYMHINKTYNLIFNSAFSNSVQELDSTG